MKLFSNEIVFKGHPDKVCDQISSALLDAYLREDPNSRCGIEVAGGKNVIFITGEVTSKADVNVERVCKRVLKEVGYSVNKYQIINNLGVQSKDIAQGTNDIVGGAGDQGMMFGYACNDTDELLPTAQVILQKFAKYYENLRKRYPTFLKSDGKAQITGVYEDDMKIQRIKTFVISYQNSETRRAEFDGYLRAAAIAICQQYNIDIDEFLINPTGRFEIGGFDGDAGLTGRKIVVDAYQSFANVGGGCMNGKDPSKVDISGAHKARQLACRYLQEKNLRWCEVQLSYAIGVAKPVAIYIDSNIGNIEPKESDYEECKPQNIIRDLHLKSVSYEKLAQFGHFTNKE